MFGSIYRGWGINIYLGIDGLYGLFQEVLSHIDSNRIRDKTNELSLVIFIYKCYLNLLQYCLKLHNVAKTNKMLLKLFKSSSFNPKYCFSASFTIGNAQMIFE